MTRNESVNYINVLFPENQAENEPIQENLMLSH